MAGFADLFGGMFGGGGPAPTPGLLDAAGYMDPAQYDAARRSQGMMGLWAGLLQGGGPSLEPRNFGSALGAGVAGMNTFGNQFDESQLQAAQAAAQRATVQKNLADIDIKKKGYQLAQDWLNKGEAPPGAAPVGGAPAGGGTGTGAVPNFGTGSKFGGIAASEHYATAIRLGATPNEAALLTSAAGAESSFNPTAVHDGGIGYGLYGHNADRLAAMRKQFGERPAAAQQIEFALNELRSRPEGARVNAAKTPEELTELQFQFERPKRGPGDQAATRLATTRAYMQNPPTAPVGAAAAAPAPGGAIPEFAGGRAGAFGGPVPAAVADARTGYLQPVPPAPVARAALPPSMTSGRAGAGMPPVGGVVVDPYDPRFGFPAGPAATSGGGAPPMLPPDADYGGGGDAGEGGPTFGYGSAGGAITPAALAAAAAAQGAPQVPATAVAPAPPIPPAPPVAPAPAPAALAPAAAAVALPPPPAGAAPGAAPAPGGMTVTLPPPPTLQLPAAGTTPQARPLPPAPETPAIPARPQIPGVAPGAAVSPAVAARARQAQGVVLGLTMMGVHVPGFLEKEAGIEIAGRTAAAEAEARQPIELQNKTFEASLTAAQKRWDALTKDQQDEVAWQRGLTGDQLRAEYNNIHERYKTILKLSTEPALQRSIGEQTLPTEITKIKEKEQAQAENTQTTMVIGGREVPMTVGQANRISRGEPPDAVLGRGVLELGKQYLTPEQQSRAQAGATKSVEYSFKRLEDADTAGGAASRNLQTMGQLAQAAERFKTGATAEMWLDVKRYARDVGLISGDDVPDGEMIRQGSTKLAVMGAPRQGAISNYERGLMATINPQLVNSPEAFAQLIEIGARLDQYDMQVARIHNEVAEKNGGVPDYLEANRRIRDLGPPISAAERGALERLQQNKAAPGGTAPTTPAAPGGAIKTPYGTIRPVQ